MDDGWWVMAKNGNIGAKNGGWEKKIETHESEKV